MTENSCCKNAEYRETDFDDEGNKIHWYHCEICNTDHFHYDDEKLEAQK